MSATTKKLSFSGIPADDLAFDNSLDPRLKTLMEVKTREGTGFELGRKRDESKTISLEYNDDDVAELQLEGGLTVYGTIDRLLEDHFPDQVEKRGQSTLTLPEKISVGGDTTRGGEEIGVRSIRLLDIRQIGIEAAGKGSAYLIAKTIESRLYGEEALYRLERQGSTISMHPSSPEEIPTGQPILVFLHGTFSSTEGSFGKIWSENNGDNLWDELVQTYGSHIYGLEHRTLTASPIENCLTLIRSLPKGCQLHLVSHSRGGLIGELLCRATYQSDRPPFTSEEISSFTGKQGTLPSSIWNIVADGYTKQQGQLTELNRLLIEKQPEIKRFVRVACPTRGTTLVSRKLDRYCNGLLNIIGLFPPLKASPLYSFLKSFLLAVVKERTSPELLPGLEAQMPTSPLIRLLNLEQEPLAADLHVIKGDTEPKGMLKRIGMLFIDRFYGSEHDMVVNTPSMTGGGRRAGLIPVMEDKGDKVLHTHYFSRSKTRRGLLAALTNDTVPEGFHLEPPDRTELSRSQVSISHRPEAPNVIVLPGVIGTHLAKGRERIWVDLSELFCGRFRQLKLQPRDHIVPQTPVASTYASLISFLEKTHNVIAFGYDWRRSLLDTGHRLADEIEDCLSKTSTAVRVVAHSMGGLVVRSMIAQRSDVWQELRARNGSKIILLGTPWQGSWSIPRILVGQEKLVRMLALLDIRDDQNDLLKIIRDFPGILEMLPHDSNGSQIPPETWQLCGEFLGRDWPQPQREKLKAAQATWDILDRAAMDPSYLFYIAGQADQTPKKMQANSDGIEFEATNHGDGQVLWATGIPKGIKHWYVEAVHGEIPGNTKVHQALLDIFETGTTEKLSPQPLKSRSAELTTPLSPDRVDYLPNVRELVSAGLCCTSHTMRPPTYTMPALEVKVTHGNLCFLDNVLAVGHYDGDTIVSAEAALDERLGNRLRHRLQAGIYPGKLFTSEMFFNEEHHRFRGAIIVGLGDPGKLTAGQLTATLGDAVLKYAMNGIECKKFAPGKIELASLLIGTGAGGISLRESIEAILEAVLQTNQRLYELYNDPDKLIKRLEFNEIFADLAIQAQRTVHHLADHSRFHGLIAPCDQLVRGEGGRTRLYSSEDADWWRRLRIASSEEDGTLTFTAMTASAKALMTSQPVSRASIDYFLEKATRTNEDTIGRVLFEMLVPPEFKPHASSNEKLMLVVDDRSAEYPWELLQHRGRKGNEAIAQKTGLIRQLATDTPNPPARLCTQPRALVIGDPDLEGMKGFEQLDGARKEANSVIRLLKKRGIHTGQPLIGAQGSEILLQLMTQEVGILHLAGHGALNFEPDDIPEGCSCTRPTPKTGMVIGNNQFLSPADIRSMPATPAFVFINCCHLGAIENKQAPGGKRYQIAANLAAQFIRQGVRAVIAAGWAVDDTGALTFANTFYSHFLDGYCFGDAVKEARIQTAKSSSTNTWGAYQCYGDPGFTFGKGIRSLRKPTIPRYHSLSEFVVACHNITSDAKTASEEYTRILRQKMEMLEATIPEEYLKEDTLIEARAGSWREINEPGKAVACLEQLRKSPTAGGTIRCVERLATLKGQLAIRLWKEQGDSSFDDSMKHLNEAKTYISNLNRLCGTSGERQTILGINERHRARLLSSRVIPGDPNSLRRLITALNEMANMSRRAYLAIQKESGELHSRPLTHWVIAEYLLDLAGEKEFDVEKAVQRLRNSALSPSLSMANAENFWQRVAPTDLNLVEYLIRGRLEEKEEEIITQYRRIMLKASSARQVCVTRGFLEFTKDILKTLNQDNTVLINILNSGIACN